jgi:hypothetical protein
MRPHTPKRRKQQQRPLMISMKNIFISSLLLISFGCKGQFNLEPSIGYAVDLNNKHYKFRQVNTSLQLCWQGKSREEMLLRLERGWSNHTLSQDSSFTLNQSLPLYTTATKKIHPEVWTLSTGPRVKLSEANSKDILSIVLLFGISYQKINVNYSYDKDNYVILNPDGTQNRFGAVVSGGLEYMLLLKKGRFFINFMATSPPLAKRTKYPSSFKWISPLALNTGFSFQLSKLK